MGEPDRTKLPIRRPPFGGVANRTLHGSVPDWDLIGHARPPAGAPNVLLVLIDDAGLRAPGRSSRFVIKTGRWLAFGIRRCEAARSAARAFGAHRGGGDGEIRRECDAVPL